MEAVSTNTFSVLNGIDFTFKHIILKFRFHNKSTTETNNNISLENA